MNRGLVAISRTMGLLVALVAASAPVVAGTITWEQAVTTQTTETGVVVALTAVNRGDEPALGVTAEMTFGGRRKIGAAPLIIQPGAVYSATASWPMNGPLNGLSNEPRGAWPLVIQIHFRDAGGESYTAPLVHVVRFDTTPDLLRMETAVLTLGERAGRVEIPVEWAGESEVRARVSFVGPQGLELVAPPPGGATVRLRPGRQGLPLVLGRGRIARSFATRSWLVVELEEPGAQGMAVVSAVDLRLLDPDVPPARPRWSVVAWVVSGLMLGGLVIHRVRRRRARQPR